MIFTRSIRWRIQAWHAVLLSLVIAGFGITAHRLESVHRLRLVDEELQALLAKLGIAVPPSPAGDSTYRSPPRAGTSLTDQITTAGAYFIVWDNHGAVQAKSSNLPAGITRPRIDAVGEANFARTLGDTRQAVHVTGAGRCFLVGRSIARELGELHQLAWYLTAAGGGVLALGLLGGWWVTTRAIRPIATIRETAQRISTGDLTQRIPTTTSDELGKLASVLNSTFSRLEAAFAQQARFTADAAHELRTPITVVLTHAQNGLATEPLSTEQRDSFQACQRAAQRMKKLIDSLLELARLDAGQEPMKHERIDLADIASDCLDLVQTLLEARNIALDLHLTPAPCAGDAQGIGQVVANLLTNAVDHTRDRIAVVTRCENGHAILTVADNGPGIAPVDLPHVFERFYRADPARCEGSTHTGLGLAIAKAIVDAHGGSLRAENSGGAKFSIALPLLASC